MVWVGCGFTGQPGHAGQRLIVGVGRSVDVDAGLLARTLDGEKQERLVLLYRTADRSAELLAAEGSFLAGAPVRGLLEVVQRVECLVAVLEKERAVEIGWCRSW